MGEIRREWFRCCRRCRCRRLLRECLGSKSVVLQFARRFRILPIDGQTDTNHGAKKLTKYSLGATSTKTTYPALLLSHNVSDLREKCIDSRFRLWAGCTMWEKCPSLDCVVCAETPSPGSRKGTKCARAHTDRGGLAVVSCRVVV